MPIPINVPIVREASQSNKPAPTAKEVLSAKAKAMHQAKPKASAGTKAEQAPLQSFDADLVSASWDTAKDAIAKAGDNAAALVDAWLVASNAHAIAAIADADGVATSARKAARRALNVLRARGVAIPTQARVVKVSGSAEVSTEATMLPPDAAGTISFTITTRHESGRHHVAEVITREPFGILQAGSGWLSGSQLKEARGRALDGLGFGPVPVPVDWAKWRVAVAKQLNAASRQVIPLGYDGCKDLFEPGPEGEPAHPLADLAALEGDEATQAIQDSAALHNEPEFRSWLPDRPAIDEMLQKVGERLGPQGISDPVQVNQILREEMDAAADRFFSPEVREIIERRMKDSTISLRSKRGAQRAQAALTVAKAIREAGLITSPPREIPFLVTFFQKALAIMVQQGGGQLRVPMASAGGVP